MRPFVLVGGSGFVGTSVSRLLLAARRHVHIVDRHQPRPELIAAGAVFTEADLLIDDLSAVFSGLPHDAHVVVLVGHGDPRPPQAWVHGLSNVAPVVRLASALGDRPITLMSTVQVYGDAPGAHTEDNIRLPWSDERLEDWIGRLAVRATDGPCLPHRVAALCRELAEVDPTGRWSYALSKRAQELVVTGSSGASTVLRLANVIGPGQEGVVARFARRAAAGRPIQVTVPSVRSFLGAEHLVSVLLADPGPGTFNLGSPSVPLIEVAQQVVRHLSSTSAIHTESAGAEPSPRIDQSRLAALGLDVAPLTTWLGQAVDRILRQEAPLCHPALDVVTPPRPQRPDEIVDRQQTALWAGRVKHGNRWSTALESTLAEALEVGPDRRLLATTSGTDALRIGIGATVGLARRGEVALLPSFTFPASAEVLIQLGYRVRFVDVDPETWTLDPTALDAALAHEPRAALALCVDTFGHPCDYPALGTVCAKHGVALVADSAAALGSRLDGRPIGNQADVHCFSMSFAKVLSAGGAGGAVVLPADANLDDHHGWTRSALMNELHAAVALDQLAALDDLVDRRNVAAARYIQVCTEQGVGYQRVEPGARHSWAHFVLRLPGGAAVRDRVASALGALGVGTKAYFRPLPAVGFGHLVDATPYPLPVTDRLDGEVLAVPMSSELSSEQVELVAVAIGHAWTEVMGDRYVTDREAIPHRPVRTVLEAAAG